MPLKEHRTCDDPQAENREVKLCCAPICVPRADRRKGTVKCGLRTHPLAICYRPNILGIEAMTEHNSTTIQQGYKFRLYPSSAQRQQLTVECDHTRWMWNSRLAWRTHFLFPFQEEATRAKHPL
jgi:putative transposase